MLKAHSSWIITTVCLTFTLIGCNSQDKIITISSGSKRSAYQRISEQINISAQAVGDLKIKDNYDSQGSTQNLKRLLDKKVDFALVQLDVASEAMKKNQVQTIAILTQEYIHIVSRDDSGIKTFADLDRKKIAVGAPGSGGYLTAQRVFQATRLNVKKNTETSDFWKKIINKQVNAFFYVGPLGTNKRVREELSKEPRLRLIPIEKSLINYLTIQFPESYREAVIPVGTYRALPPLPPIELPTILTPGVLVTRPDVDKKTVSLLTWAIISTVRQYAAFYPELAGQEPERLLHQGLIYIHPGAQQAYKHGDPRDAWLRYLEENTPLQAASIMLLSSTIIGYTLRRLQKRKTNKIIQAHRQAVNNLRSLLPETPQKAIDSIEALRQNYRQLFVQGEISPETYQQVEQMNNVFLEECRIHQAKIRSEQIDLILQTEEKKTFYLEGEFEALQKAAENYHFFLLSSGHIDLKIYLQLKQIDLLKMIFHSLQSKID